MRPPDEFDYKIYRFFRWLAVLPTYLLATFFAIVVMPLIIPAAVYEVEVVAMLLGIVIPICCAVAVAPRYRIFVSIGVYVFGLVVSRFLGLTGPPPFLEHLIDFVSQTWYCLLASLIVAAAMDRWTATRVSNKP